MNKLLQPSFRLYFACLILFALLSAAFCWQLALVELALVLLLALYSHQAAVRRRRELNKYLDSYTGNVDTATKDTMINSPLPMVLFRPESGDIIWTNERFLRLSDQREHLYDSTLSALIPGFDTRWLMEGKNQCPAEVSYSGRRFLVYGHLVRTGGRGGGFLATTYWVDVTELCLIRDQYQATRPVAAVLLLDNYEDLLKNLSENERSTIMAEIDSRIESWVADTGGILRRYQRERYLFVFEQRHLGRFIESKFDILDAIHQVVNPSGMNASLSIGVGTDGSRVMANALSSLVSDSSQVFIMGHKAPDNDAVGAAAGVCALCRKNGVPAHIIREAGPTPSQVLIDRLQQLPEYHDCFLSAQDALLIADNRSLVVVVDTNRPEQVQALEVLQSCNRVAVIDHHRRAATYIEGAALNYHEPYASSASELVTELLQYVMEPAHLLRAEAEALLAGIVLDTKNFTMRTGGRTFEAAAFLRRSGADTAEVKKLFQNDLAGTIAKYSIIQNAKLYRDGIAVAVADRPVGRVTAAQAADELLNIIGIDASFVISPDGERVNISGRSMGDTNVQLILEKLGGGGNAAAAGGQVSGKSVDEVAQELARAIDQYLEEE
ncbi:MAG: DHH family phosphoesterase [Lawsonibacter sp.]|nr:DHH family phosphoesterase [Lawsonibacter sp.]